MKVFFDTSVLIAAVIESHPRHQRAHAWLARALAGEFEWSVACHTLAEMYAVLTTLPVKPRISPGTAARLIRENVENSAKVVSLSVEDYSSTLKKLAERGITGGNIYDALIARAAMKSEAGKLLTLNVDDFRRAWPDGERIIAVP